MHTQNFKYYLSSSTYLKKVTRFYTSVHAFTQIRPSSINCSHLYRGDRSLFGGGDSFLHGTHVSGQGRLITHSRRDSAQ